MESLFSVDHMYRTGCYITFCIHSTLATYSKVRYSLLFYYVLLHVLRLPFGTYQDMPFGTYQDNLEVQLAGSRYMTFDSSDHAYVMFIHAELARDWLQTTNKYVVEGGIISPVHDAYGKKVWICSTIKCACSTYDSGSGALSRLKRMYVVKENHTLTLGEREPYFNPLPTDVT